MRGADFLVRSDHVICVSWLSQTFHFAILELVPLEMNNKLCDAEM